jgi:hypothetical protein
MRRPADCPKVTATAAATACKEPSPFPGAAADLYQRFSSSFRAASHRNCSGSRWSAWPGSHGRIPAVRQWVQASHLTPTLSSGEQSPNGLWFTG